MKPLNSMFRIKFIAIFILLFTTLLVANPAKAIDSTASNKLNIAVIPERGDLDFWHLLKKGAIKAATDDGNIKVLWISPAGYGSFKEQKKKLEWCIQNNVDAVVISPVHGLRMKNSLKRTIRKGIPVIQMVSRISNKIKTGYVHSDNFKGGALAAEYLHKKLNGSGAVVLGMFTKGNSPVNRRIEGFKHQLKESGSKLKVAKAIYVGKQLDKDSSKIRVAMYGNDNPSRKKKINAVIGFNESSSEILLKTLDQLNKRKGMAFVAFNPDPQMISEINQGTISAGIAQDPYEIGRIAVTQAAMAARGQKIPTETTTKVYLVTKDNLLQPKIQEVLGLTERTP
ncbi:substrate-binding domain-containing protein [Desulfovibrio sp. JC022]|uniref:substrate-binding domain-containing protein n=1 Tax=Desulfovibrio sp. JC022 TaxID=2593642 RepID=UPI0013D8575B|nr:substrate-binding domain-containing protein [Desulfovibrio sp. JC022]NDV23410.1 substrate-binding domain-containing protein [Desulfovibrio sp. JC022]